MCSTSVTVYNNLPHIESARLFNQLKESLRVEYANKLATVWVNNKAI